MITRRQIGDALRSTGLQLGDCLFVHSSLRAVGPIEGGPEALIDGLLDAVGAAGTLAMPSFHYTRPLPDPYWDPLTTPAKTGALTERFRARPGVRRSIHPTHSILAQGNRAEEFTADAMRYPAFGIGSPLDRIAQAGGWALLIGVTHTSNSCIHVGEVHANVPKFFWNEGPLPIAKVRMPDGTIVHHQLDCTASCSAAFNAVDLPLRRRGQIVDLNIGLAACYLMRCRDVIDAVIELWREYPGVLGCTKPTCRPCTLGRKHLLERPKCS